jgi:hypothetical protein
MDKFNPGNVIFGVRNQKELLLVLVLSKTLITTDDCIPKN